MSIITNKNTQQNPIVTGGLGIPSIRFIEAPRVYLLADGSGNPKADPTANTPVQQYTAYSCKSNGATPVPASGTNTWLDLGIVEEAVKITYQKKVQEIRTGLDQVLRAAYTKEKVGQFEFTLDQFSDYVLNKVSGLTGSVTTPGSTSTFHIGQEDLAIVGILLVNENKLDGIEMQFYNPAAYLNFEFVEKSNALGLKCTGLLPFFQAAGQTVQEMLAVTDFQ